jgi:hypothetical protein
VPRTDRDGHLPLDAALREITVPLMRWTGMRSIVHRGYWLVTSLYLVLDANLSAFQLVFLGTAQGIVALVCEVPAGVVAGTISRTWALVIAHAPFDSERPGATRSRGGPQSAVDG